MTGTGNRDAQTASFQRRHPVGSIVCGVHGITIGTAGGFNATQALPTYPDHAQAVQAPAHPEP